MIDALHRTLAIADVAARARLACTPPSRGRARAAWCDATTTAQALSATPAPPAPEERAHAHTRGTRGHGRARRGIVRPRGQRGQTTDGTAPRAPNFAPSTRAVPYSPRAGTAEAGATRSHARTTAGFVLTRCRWTPRASRRRHGDYSQHVPIKGYDASLPARWEDGGGTAAVCAHRAGSMAHLLGAETSRVEGVAYTTLQPFGIALPIKMIALDLPGSSYEPTRDRLFLAPEHPV